MKNVETSLMEMEKTIGKEILTSPDGVSYREFKDTNGNIHRMYLSDSQSRLEDESYEMYRIRRTVMNTVNKNKLRGVKVWPPMGFKNIPYTQELDEKIGQLYDSIIKNRKEDDGN